MKQLFNLILFLVILFFSCSKNSDDAPNISNEELPQLVTNGLINIDSLSQFRAIFKNMKLTNSETEGGITILAPVNNGLITPTDPQNFKNYIIKGIVPSSGFTNGSTFKSISGVDIKISITNERIYANGAMISTLPIATAASYSIYASSGLYVTGPPRYNDPHVNEYYVSYLENGVFHTLAGSYINTWAFFDFQNFPTPTSGSCNFPSFQPYSSGPAQATIAFTQIIPFFLQLNRANFTTIPQEGSYFLSKASYNTTQDINNGNCNLIINGARFACGIGDDDAYVSVTVSEVKIDQAIGVEKRGYYKGVFDAILYKTDGSSMPLKKTITQGQFKVPIGGNETSPVNGNVPIIDLKAILTVGKWYFTPLVQTEMQSPDSGCKTCNLDDYIIFRVNNTCDWSEGNNICPLDSEGCIEYESNIQWVLNSNQTILTMGGQAFNILQITENTITTDGTGTLMHGN